MSRPILIDTSFVMALVDKNDEYHQIAVDLSFRLDESRAVITDVIFLEIGASLARKFKQEAIAIIENFIASQQVRVIYLTPTLFQNGFELYKKTGR